MKNIKINPLTVFIYVLFINYCTTATIKMKIKRCKDSKIITSDPILTINDQVALSAYLPCSKVPQDYYELFLVLTQKDTKDLLQIKIRDIYHYTEDENNWQRIDNLSWVDVPSDNVTSYGFILQRKANVDPITVHGWPESLNVGSNSTETKHNSGTFEKVKWEYDILIKDKSESAIGIRELENKVISNDFCALSILTDGPAKTLGASCPIDPETKEQMKQCLNWRRTDDVGKQCRKIITKETKENSIVEFCNNNYDAEDCRCVNRYNEKYKEEKELHPEHDYCWYTPCSSGYYLVKEQDTKITCNAKNCVVVYRIDKTGGNVNFHDNSTSLQCESYENTQSGTSNTDTSINTVTNHNNVKVPENSRFHKNNNETINFNYFHIFLISILILILVVVITKK